MTVTDEDITHQGTAGWSHTILLRSNLTHLVKPDVIVQDLPVVGAVDLDLLPRVRVDQRRDHTPQRREPGGVMGRVV